MFAPIPQGATNLVCDERHQRRKWPCGYIGDLCLPAVNCATRADS